MIRKKPTTVFVYLLGAYVLLQFLWWGYHLIDLTQQAQHTNSLSDKRVLMIIGEGTVFLILLLVGLWFILRSIKKEIEIAQQKSNFLLSVTHELKTPIATTKLYLQTIQKHKLSEDKQNEIIVKALDESMRLELLVEQILTASRLEQHTFKTVIDAFSFKNFLLELIEIQRKRIDIPINLIEFDDFEVISDHVVLSHVVNNLIDNGAKYGKSDKGIELSVARFDSYITLKVRDFGKGIPLEFQPKLFQKFIRLENEETRTTKGTGLGLYIAKQCAKALGGNLKLIKVEGPGACFELQMPNYG
ncbi:MAG TPA: HAMP domain-containing sensor histidine kinase [Fluviicola sp.]|nr:HAMP domain-containing sensor histidine kinase [Fluviicola sp.]